MRSKRQRGSGEGRVSTGVPGLDDVLSGGLPRGGVYLLEGQPGVGKTTLALQFLMAGAAAGEKTLHVAMTESRAELSVMARTHGWSLEGVEVLELALRPGRYDWRLVPEAGGMFTDQGSTRCR